MNKISSKKLLNSKWTAVSPNIKEKHFLIIELELDENNKVDHCVIEAVISNRTETINWEDLKESKNWLHGWK